MYHQCPYCGYTIPDVKLQTARFDYKCPKCKSKTLSEFNVVNTWDCLGLLFDGLPRDELAGQKEDAQ